MFEATDNEVREKIIFAAAKTFDEKRYQLTSISDIAVMAGVEQVIVASFFKSKEEIALVIIEKQNAISQNQAKAILDENRPAVESLLRISARLGQDIIENTIVRVGTRLNTEVLALSQPLARAWQDWAGIISLLLAKGIKERDIRDDIDVTVFSNFISKAYYGVQLASGLTTNYSDLMEATFEMWIVILGSCSVEEKRRHLFRAANEIVLLGNTDYNFKGFL